MTTEFYKAESTCNMKGGENHEERMSDTATLSPPPKNCQECSQGTRARKGNFPLQSAEMEEARGEDERQEGERQEELLITFPPSSNLLPLTSCL
jgi:hypothetical protein